MQAETLHYLYEQDAFAAIEHLYRQTDHLATARVFAELVQYLYWQKKDIHRVIMMAEAGIQFGLASALLADAADAKLAEEFRSIAKGLAYNLGAFTWPGWNEPGISLHTEHLSFGREGALLNLRLAFALRKENLPLSRAYWLVGAHDLATERYETACEHFAEARRLAELAEASEESLLCTGYQHLASFLACREAEAQKSFLAIQESLAKSGMQTGFAEQLATAWKVFTDSPFAEQLL